MRGDRSDLGDFFITDESELCPSSRISALLCTLFIKENWHGFFQKKNLLQNFDLARWVSVNFHHSGRDLLFSLSRRLVWPFFLLSKKKNKSAQPDGRRSWWYPSQRSPSPLQWDGGKKFPVILKKVWRLPIFSPSFLLPLSDYSWWEVSHHGASPKTSEKLFKCLECCRWSFSACGEHLRPSLSTTPWFLSSGWQGRG